MTPTSGDESIADRVARVRDLIDQEGLQGILVRSTDRFLNEYVPLAESTRVWLTGFTGSTGEALVTLDQAWLAVDGRYYLQADRETEGTPFEVKRVPLGVSLSTAVSKLASEEGKNGLRRLGYEPDRFSVRALADLERALAGSGVELVPTLPSLVERARGDVAESRGELRVVAPKSVGATVVDRIERARAALDEAAVEALVVQRLDELAWLTNLRGRGLPFQATFRGLGLLTPSEVVLAMQESPSLPRAALPAGIRLVPPGEWSGELSSGGRVGYDPVGTTSDVVEQIRARGAEPVAMTSPLTALKARKNERELAVMKEAFRRADGVMDAARAFVAARLDAAARVSEADLADEVARLFEASGGVGLSFKVIAAAGKNGAVIHYSTPDPGRAIAPDELVLLDTGTYYHEGYATDLTRTWLAGSPEAVPEASPEQRRIFTLVLKAAIAGMSARIPIGTRGDQLDALVRAPLWAAGLDYNHGTGHGVGVNVHEAPPRISTRGATPLEVGHVFSIEPGLYLPEFGGVRIENLCTLVPSDTPGFLDVTPLTFADLDRRLIDDALLTSVERDWLAGYLVRR